MGTERHIGSRARVHDTGQCRSQQGRSEEFQSNHAENHLERARTISSEKEDAVTAALIRQRVEDLAKAVSAKDTDGVTSFYAANIVSFDLNPPLGYAGADAKRRAWREAFAA